jgi:hypothetical protein
MSISIFGQSLVDEGLAASYFVSLSTGLFLPGQVITFNLRTIAGTAIERQDYLPISPNDIRATKADILVSAASLGDSILVRLENRGSEPLEPGSLIGFTVLTLADRLIEPTEIFTVEIADANIGIDNSQVTTGIIDAPIVIRENIDPSRWNEINGDFLFLGGISGGSLPGREILVETGDNSNFARFTDAIAFATLDLGEGDNELSVFFGDSRDDILNFLQFGHGAYFATIRAGDGDNVINIQSAQNFFSVRSSPQDSPGYNLPDYYQSTVEVGNGNNYVYAFLPFQSTFKAGAGIDYLFFYGRFSDWSYDVVDDTDSGTLDITLSDAAQDYSVWTVGENVSSTARNNRVQGFEFIQFNDILLKVREAVAIAGPARVDEGSAAVYAISLAGDGLRAQESVTFDLQVASLSATPGLDYTELAASFLRGAGNAVKLDVIAFDPVAQTLRAVVTANRDLARDTVIANLSIPTANDAVVEGPEQFSVTLSGFVDPVAIVTTIVDNDVAAITLSGPASVAEGATTTPYSVSLSSVGLGVGQSVTFTLDTASGSATEGIDFSALGAEDLVAAAGVTLTTSTGAGGVITITATNRSVIDLGIGVELLNFTIRTTQDQVVEGDETYRVMLGSSTAEVVNGSIETIVNDDDAAAIALSGPGIVEEGLTTTPYVVSLSGVALAAGQSITFTLDTSTGSAIEGGDFRALTADDLRAGRGVTLSQVTTNRDGLLTVTAQNTSGSELSNNAQLLRFRIATIDDNVVRSVAEPFRAPTSAAPISDGVYKVGVDIEPGVYRGELTASAGDFAFWQISSDPNGADIISNALPTGPFFVSVEQDQFLEIRRARLSFFEPPPSGVAGSSLSRQLTVSIASQDANVTASSVGTVIDDNDVAILALSGPSSVREGRTTRPYTVSLGDVALADGVEVPLEIRLRSLSATLGEDFRPLSSQSVTAASGVTLSGFEPSTDGTLKLRLTNSSGSLIEAGSRLLRFSVDTIPDNLVEGDERFRVALASESANILKGSKSVRTTIRDSVVSAEDGGSNVFVLAEGVRRPRVVRGTNRADVITGNEFNNVLYGRKGADLLTGGGGQDVFQFRLRDGLDQGDVITDFTPRNDRIQLRDVPKNSLAASLYNGKKTLSASNVNRAFEQILDPSRAERSSAVFVYSSLTGDLFYNANGSARGFGADGGVIATLPVLLDFNARDVILSYSS